MIQALVGHTTSKLHIIIYVGHCVFSFWVLEVEFQLFSQFEVEVESEHPVLQFPLTLLLHLVHLSLELPVSPAPSQSPIIPFAHHGSISVHDVVEIKLNNKRPWTFFDFNHWFGAASICTRVKKYGRFVTEPTSGNFLVTTYRN